MNKLNEVSVLKSLSRKQDVRITPKSKKIILLTSDSNHRKNDLGGGSYGKIDYLTSQKGYTILKVDKFINFNKSKKKRSTKRPTKIFSAK